MENTLIELLNQINKLILKFKNNFKNGDNWKGANFFYEGVQGERLLPLLHP